MLLTNIDEETSNVFQQIFDNFSLSSIILILSGVILGVIITTMVVAITTANSLKSKKKKVNESISINELELTSKINNIKKELIKSSTGLKVKDKLILLKESVIETLNTVASTYYPNSKHPLFELSIEEIILLFGYIENRLDEIFDKPILKVFRKMKVSQILTLIDVKKKIDDNKVVKAAKKTNLGKVASVVKGALNIVNPIYWIKKGITTTTINIGYDKLASIIIDIVADETNKTYSKVVFNKEIEQNIGSIEEEIEEIGDDIYE